LWALYISGVCFVLFLCVKKLKTRTQNTAKHKTPQNKHRETCQNTASLFFFKTLFTVTVFKKTKNIHKTHKHKNTRKIAQ